LAVTAAELVFLVFMTPTFSVIDWIYVLQHLLVLAIALTRPRPTVIDRSLSVGFAVVLSYAYPYAQVALLRWVPGEAGWPTGGLVLVIVSAFLSCVSLLALGRRFGVLPAVRGLATRGPYRLVRHPMYLAYVLADIGYNLQEWNVGTIVCTLVGWGALVYRVKAEERVLQRHGDWASYVARVRYRIIPGVI
jgi:protein-S-isoprenylcysteine O-methyltransferase Ste14